LGAVKSLGLLMLFGTSLDYYIYILILLE
jgi:hypothetical protein